MPEERVTLRDVYAALNRLEDKLGKNYGDRFKAIEQDIEDIRSFQNKAIGVLGVLSLFFGAISNFIWERLLGK